MDYTPKYSDGTEILLGDCIKYNNKVDNVMSIEVLAEEGHDDVSIVIACRCGLTFGINNGALDKYIQVDTLDTIMEDAEMDAYDYCKQILNIKTEEMWSLSNQELEVKKAKDLLNRQKLILEKPCTCGNKSQVEVEPLENYKSPVEVETLGNFKPKSKVQVEVEGSEEDSANPEAEVETFNNYQPMTLNDVLNRLYGIKF